MSATDHARGLAGGSPVRWRQLEVLAFTGHPRIQAMLDPRQEYGKYKGASRARLVLMVPVMLVGVAVLFAPVWGLATVMEFRFGATDSDPGTVIPTAGIIYLVALPFLVAHSVTGLRKGRRPDLLLRYQAGTAFFVGALTAAVATARGVRAGFADWPLWTLPIVVLTIVGGVTLLLSIRASRRTRPEEAKGSGQPEQLRHVRRAVEELAPAERERVRVDLDAAIGVLEHRSLVTVQEAERARGADLGMLALHMSQQRRAARKDPGAAHA